MKGGRALVRGEERRDDTRRNSKYIKYIEIDASLREWWSREFDQKHSQSITILS